MKTMLGKYKYLSGAANAVRLLARRMVRDRGGVVHERFAKERDWSEGVSWVAEIEPYGFCVVWIEDDDDTEDNRTESCGIVHETVFVRTETETLGEQTWGIFLRYQIPSVR